MDWMVMNIQLIWKFVYMLRKYKTCNLIMEFSKYKFNKKLLSCLILLRDLELYIYIYIYIYNFDGI